MFQADGGLALVAVLAAGAGRLERAHLALLHELLVAHPQVVDAGAGPRPILSPRAAAPAVAGSIRAGGHGRGGEGEAERGGRVSAERQEPRLGERG